MKYWRNIMIESLVRIPIDVRERTARPAGRLADRAAGQGAHRQMRL
jgi:hypothetical protein